jgi:hypothetical protein
MRYGSKYASMNEVRAALDAAALELCRARGDTGNAPGGDASREAAATVAAFLRALPASIRIPTGSGDSIASMCGFDTLARMIDDVTAGAGAKRRSKPGALP